MAIQQSDYVNPGHFLFGLVAGTATSTILGLLGSRRTEVTGMFYEAEVREGNPEFIYVRELEDWERVPTELTGHSLDELATDLIIMENSLEEGGKAKIQLLSDTLPSDADLEAFYADMIDAGFHSTKPTAKIINGIPAVEMVLRKGSPIWTMLIPLIPTAIIGGLIVFGITKLEAITKALIPLMLVTGGLGIVALGLVTRKPVVETAGKYITSRR